MEKLALAAFMVILIVVAMALLTVPSHPPKSDSLSLISLSMLIASFSTLITYKFAFTDEFLSDEQRKNKYKLKRCTVLIMQFIVIVGIVYVFLH